MDYIIAITGLLVVIASFLAGRNYERVWQKWQKAQPTIKAVKQSTERRR